MRFPCATAVVDNAPLLPMVCIRERPEMRRSDVVALGCSIPRCVTFTCVPADVRRTVLSS